MNLYHKHILPNGLELITIPMPVDSVTVMVMIAAGSRFETKSINGLTHFMEHMAFKGSTKRPSAFAISSEIDAIGGEFNAFTGKDHTGFYIKARSEHLPLLIDVLSDMILHPLLKEEEIEREKGVIIEEIHLYEDTPMRHISDVYEELLYGDTPLGRDTAGKPKNIRSITKADFQKYLDNLYRPENSIVVVAGGIETADSKTGRPASPARFVESRRVGGQEDGKIINLVEKGLGSWKKKPSWQFERMTDKQDQPQIKLQYKKTEQAHMALGVRAYPLNHPQRYVLSLLTAILGGGMSSRLFTEVRERRGLAYYVRAESSQYQDVGNFVVTAGVDVARIDQAISVIKDQLIGLSAGKYPVTDKELQKAKAYIKGITTLELEDNRSLAGFYGTQEILKREIVTPQEYFAKIEKVTLKEIYKVAKEIFVSKHINLAIIGPFKDEARFRQILNSKS